VLSHLRSIWGYGSVESNVIEHNRSRATQAAA
jgi:hypothetical protein